MHMQSRAPVDIPRARARARARAHTHKHIHKYMHASTHACMQARTNAQRKRTTIQIHKQYLIPCLRARAHTLRKRDREARSKKKLANVHASPELDNTASQEMPI